MSTPDNTQRTPDVDQPDGGDDQTTGRTPHAQAPAEGADPDTVENAEDGTDPDNRISGA